MVRVILLTFAITVASGQRVPNCQWVSTLDCKRYPTEYLCASNSITYDSRCRLAKAQCNNNTIHLIGLGTCVSLGPIPVTTTASARPQTTTTTNFPTTPVKSIFANHNALHDKFCLELMHETCPIDTEAVCGSDNVTYDNFCEFEKARCFYTTLQVLHFGKC